MRIHQAWEAVEDTPPLPYDFSWQRISRGFKKKTKSIRDSIPELKAIFAQEMSIIADKAVAGSIGPQPDFDLETYAEALLEKFGRPGSLGLSSMDLDGAAYDAVRLWQVFVPQSVRESRNLQPSELELPKGEKERHEKLRPYFDQLPRPVLEVCADQQFQRLVILGEPGSGKSSLLRFLVLEWAREPDANRRALAPVPLLIELREYHSKRRQGECSDSFLSYMHKAYSLHRFNQNDLDDLLKKTPDRFLLLLDGLDEIFDRQEREQVISDIHRFSNQYKNVRIIITSRVVGYEAHRLRDAEFSDFMLQDFSSEQIDEFLHRWHEVIFAENQTEGQGKRERLAKAIKDSQPIAQLAGNPLMLTMMAIINRNRALPRKRVKLYEQATELFLQQWDTEGKLLNEFPGLSEEVDFDVKVAILRKVAVAMQTVKGQAANIIQKEDLRKLIEDYLREELHFSKARAAANALINQLRDRNFILCFIGDHSFAFVHRTFLEYFCSTEFVHRFRHKQTLSLEGLLALYDAHCRDDDWQEVLRLICGQLDEKFAGGIIAHLTKRVDIEAWDKKTPIPELTLAVWCLSEVNNLKRIEGEIGAELLLKVVGRFLLSAGHSNRSRSGSNDNDDQLLAATKVVGLAWPGKSVFHFTGQYPEGDSRYSSQWPNFLNAVFRQRHWIEQLCEAENPKVRKASLEALTMYWPDSNTRRLLRERSMQDLYEDVREMGLKQLALSWLNDDIKRKIIGKELAPQEILELVSGIQTDDERQLLVRCALQDESKKVRTVALGFLMLFWPDNDTRQFFFERAVLDIHEDIRRELLEDDGIVEIWPDSNTRQLLQERAVHDVHEDVRSVVLKSLCKYWINDKIYQLLHERIRKDVHEKVRSTALKQLVAYWPDDETRQLLRERLVKDKHEEVRKAALKHLVEHWPDDDTYQLFFDRVVKDPSENIRRSVLGYLVEQECNESVHQLLRECVVKDAHEEVRKAALKYLVEHWPDGDTYQLLRERVGKDTHEKVRAAALEYLGQDWLNDETRQLFRERIVKDAHGEVREEALQQLALSWLNSEMRQKIRDEGMTIEEVLGLVVEIQANDDRQLFTHCVLHDEDKEVRSSAVVALIILWPDRETHQLLCERAPHDEGGRSTILRLLAIRWPDEAFDKLVEKYFVVNGVAASFYGKRHSPFGEIVFREYPEYNWEDYLDPHQPIPTDHIQQAAKEAGIPSYKLDETVRSLSEHMGWDITKGSEAGKLA